MKVAIGSFGTETHSFSKDLTTLDCFKTCIWDDAGHLVANHKGQRGEGGGAVVGGFVDYSLAQGWEIVPLFAAGAWPSGPVPAEAYRTIKDNFRQVLENLDADAVLLHLHGAAVVEGIDDAEGDFLSFVREHVGNDTPVISILDLHANVSDLMCEKADALFGYDTYPHIDPYERQIEACHLLEDMLAGKKNPVMFRAQPPILLPAILTGTNSGPMKKIMERAVEWEKNDKVINVSPFAGYYASDKYEAGASVVVMTDNDPELAKAIAKDMADVFWELKDGFFMEMTPIEEAINMIDSEAGTWVFFDECDDPLGGGASDGTFLLQKILDAGVKSGGVSVIRDPEIVAKAFEAGTGGIVSGKLGGKIDSMHGDPVEINARVLKLLDEKIPIFDGDDTTKQNVGRIAVIEERGVKIVVVELKGGFESINIFRILGFDTSEMKVLVLKGSSGALKSAYEGLFVDSVYPESLGITNPDVTKIGDFQHIRRPVYPLDENVDMRYV